MSYSGFTPLHYAILADDMSLVRFLLDNGADPSMEDNKGCVPSDYCTNKEITNLLNKFIIKVHTFLPQLLTHSLNTLVMSPGKAEATAGEGGGEEAISPGGAPEGSHRWPGGTHHSRSSCHSPEREWVGR